MDERSRETAREGVTQRQLEPLVEAGATTRQIATALGLSQTTIRHWLRRYALSTRRSRPAPAEATVTRECRHHGITEFVRYGPNDHHRCRQCRHAAVTSRRRRIKEILVAEAGGRCELCGYGRFAGALQFHHRDRADKDFGIALNGSTRSLDRARSEARKCALLCANCHAEVEWGTATVPVRTRPDVRDAG